MEKLSHSGVGGALIFGLSAEVPENAPAAWGARAIQDEDQFDLVRERQDTQAVSDTYRRVLEQVFAFRPVLEQVKENYAKLYWQGKLRPDKHKTEVLYEDHALVVKGNTNASYGYLYLCAYIKPDEELDKLPPPGSVVNMKVNSIGQGLLVRRVTMHKYPHAIVLPFNPPEWYRQQNKFYSKWSCCGAVPNELELVQ